MIGAKSSGMGGDGVAELLDTLAAAIKPATMVDVQIDLILVKNVQPLGFSNTARALGG